MIGKLEELTLLACIRAGEDAVPSAIYEVMMVVGQPIAGFGAVYTTLGRLAKKGLLRERSVTDAQGRERRSFSITVSGRAALNESVGASTRIAGIAWAGV
ncbi:MULTISPECIES: PadR family transcriptional regulator [unclassified Sphingomonas]|uniref:PadR family transcriptional regulator n=1 Tax=unclassified Sphingomonas TaxID=196159 RepID=UPI00138F9B10|nr:MULTISPECIES: helix-turn-helix transcriptional regulator [unclassified Sphingomonas]